MTNPEPSGEERTRADERNHMWTTGGAPSGARWPEDPVAPSDAGSWQEEVKTASGLNVLAGIWLIISPFVIGYAAELDAYWNPIVSGAIVLVLALVRVVVPTLRTAWMSAINAGIGIWLFISAFWLADSGEAVWNTWVLGVIVFFLAVWSAATSPQRAQPA